MNLKQIEAVRLVARTGSVSVAARRLAVSQPAVSKMLISLERSLGIALFEHRRGAVVPREELNLLLPHIERVYEALAELDLQARALSDPRQEQLIVGCSAALSLSVVGPACARVMESMREANITVRVRNGRGLIGEVVAGHVDLAITQLDAVDGSLPTRNVGHCGMMCVLPPGHPLRAAPAVTAADLQTYPIITYTPSTRNGARTRAYLEQHGIRPDAVTVDQAAVACLMALRLGRLAVIESLVDLEALYPELSARPLVPSMPYSIYAVWHDRPQSPVMEAVIADVEQVIGVISGRRSGGHAGTSGEDPGAPVEHIVGDVA